MTRTRDFTSGNPTPLMLKFAVPMMLTMVLQNLYHTVNMIVVGRFVGQNALAAVGTTGSIAMLVLMLITGATMGMSVVISQFYGAKDIINVKKAIATSFYLIAGLAIVCCGLGAVFTRELLLLTQVPLNIIDDASIYLRIFLIGSILTAMYNMAVAIMRSLGDSMTPMIILLISSVFNIILSVLFVTQFALGVAGVAYATVTATSFSVIASWTIVWKKLPIAHPTRETVKPDPAIIKMVLKIGIPSATQYSSMAFGNVIIQTIINGFGPIVIAGFSAAIRIEMLVANAPGGVTGAMQVFTGQNVGARLYDRVRDGFRSALKVIAIFSICSLTVFIIFGKSLIGIFTTEGGEMIEIGYRYLVISGSGAIFIGIMFLTRAILTGAGDGMAVIYISVIELSMRIAAALILSMYIGYIGVFIATVAGWLAGSSFGYIRYKGGKWTEKGFVKVPDRS